MRRDTNTTRNNIRQLFIIPEVKLREFVHHPLRILKKIHPKNPNGRPNGRVDISSTNNFGFVKIAKAQKLESRIINTQ